MSSTTVSSTTVSSTTVWPPSRIIAGSLGTGPWSRLLAILVVLTVLDSSVGDDASADSGSKILPPVGASFSARDTLDCDDEPDTDARQCLQGLRWQPDEFRIEIAAPDSGRGDRTIYFPSPLPIGNPVHDRVAVEWYGARDDDGELIDAPAVVVVHESGRSMPIGRMIARGLSSRGVHALMVQLPGYGLRRTELADRPEMMLTGMRQGIADVRRARDVASVLPGIETLRIGLQGTSLGGFVTATVAGLDGGFDRIFILLAGGRLDQVILQGKRDAAKVRRQIEAQGVRPDQIAALVKPVEPLRLAHRIDPSRTWLYTGLFDNVVPRASSWALAQAAGLEGTHHIELPADHYTGIIFMPAVLQQIRDAMVEGRMQPLVPVD